MLTPIYSLRVSEVYEFLETSPTGLTSSEVEARQRLYGKNTLAVAPRPSVWQKALPYLRHPFTVLFLLAALLALWQNDYPLAGVILTIASLNTLLSLWREWQAEQAANKLAQLLPSFAHVLRDGQEQHILAEDIVPGDLLILAEGDNIPADARVVEAYGLRVNNAALTGEAVPALKVADASLQNDLSELERPNLVFAGTCVAAGTGKAVVYATGMTTQFGRIAHLTQAAELPTSPLQQELQRIGQRLMWIATAFGIVVFLVSAYEPHVRYQIASPLLLALGVVAAITPEGLPATLTLSLAMAVQRLAAKGVLAKRLSIVETLGNVSVICTDKSGTLTQNQMTVREIWVARQSLRVSGSGREPKGEFKPAPNDQPFESDFHLLMQAALCCNNARLLPPTPQQPRWGSLGDQTEVALKVCAYKAGLDEAETEARYPRLHEIPFDARRKRMTTIHSTAYGEIAFVKGSPREVLQLCTHIHFHGERVPLDEKTRAEILAANDEYARHALRVLALAYREWETPPPIYAAEHVERDLTFLGLVAMMDPPRPEVERAIQICRQAGIRLVMITGDYGLGRPSLARRIGLIRGTPLIITGAELDAMDDRTLARLLDREVIFARMAPEHKLRLVAAFQNHGEVVAVTGDGVNDAPALRKADVGIAMGTAGSDVAREAADIILIQDDFGAVVSAIEEGRAVYDNIRKFITYIFSSNVPEIAPFLMTALFGLPLALNVHQILSIDLGTDIVPAIALGSERPEPGIMERPPRKRDQPLLDRNLFARAFLWLGLLEAALCYLAYFSVYLFSGNAALLPLSWLNHVSVPLLLSVSPDTVVSLARTVFFAAAITAQIGNAFACRSAYARSTEMGWFSNRWLWLGIGLEIVILAALLYVPPLARLFEHQPLPGMCWALLGLNPLLLYGLEKIRKALARRVPRRR